MTDYKTTDYEEHYLLAPACRRSNIGNMPAATYRVKFSTRGRVTIPAPLRKIYGIKAGVRVAFEMTPTGAILLKPRK